MARRRVRPGATRPSTVIALVFLGSAGVAALLFALDARQRRTTGASVPSGPAEQSPAPDDASAAASPTAPPPASAAPRPVRSARPLERPEEGACPRDMVLVAGEHCPFVAHRCTKSRPPARPGEPATCEKFANEVLCEGALIPMRFCMDRFEYPNVERALPAVLISFEHAEAACAAEGKRLCAAREWAFACEGEAVLPYPIGLERTASACNWDAGPEARVVPSRGPTVERAVAKVDRRAPAGERAGCDSPFGARDLAGNVAEWVVEPINSRTRHPFASVIAGGAWGKGPGTCRALDDGHPPLHRAVTVGFRCCADAFGAGPPRATGRKGAGLVPIVPPRGLP
ncbi:MAG: SUMF1/EgtB/PvdO family nonheme iron enzyme [Polyangiaceae bacterium]|nr:SUMF1/EgtB/PvdO family nonheme iron enzyme [Polyangiaceae bacterium]